MFDEIPDETCSKCLPGTYLINEASVLYLKQVFDDEVLRANTTKLV
jgi:hypothetical protein